MLLISGILLYDLPGMNVKFYDRQLSRHTLDKSSGPIYGELEKTITYILESWDRVLQKWRGISMVTKRLWDKHKGSHLPAENGTNLIHIQFSEYGTWHTFWP